MSMIEAGIPLYETFNTYLGVFYARVTDESVRLKIDTTHRAYPVEHARALEAVVEAARAYDEAADDAVGGRTDSITVLARLAVLKATIRALDALAAAGSSDA